MCQVTRRLKNTAPPKFGAIHSNNEEGEVLGTVRSMDTVRTVPYSNEGLRAEQELDLERSRSIPIIP
jgi:hypothetical protein